MDLIHEVQLFKRTRMCVHNAITRDANINCFAEIWEF